MKAPFRASALNLANGKGLDHLADLVGPQVVALYFAALTR